MARAEILIVEDESIVAETIRSSVENMGFKVSAIASSGREAIQATKLCNPDLVLMDILLKGDMDGIEAARKIRSLNDIPIIYLTATTGNEFFEPAKETSPFGYVVKPFKYNELKNAIEIALDKHKIEKELRTTKDRYRSLFEGANDGIILYNFEGIIIDLNVKALSMLGYQKKSELIDLPLQKLHCESEQEVSRQAFEVTKSRGSARFESKFIKKDGTIIEVEISSSIINGRRAMIQGIVRDITERKKNEEAIRVSELRRRKLFEESLDGICLAEAETGIIVDCNKSFVNLIGWNKSDLIGKSQKILHPGSDRIGNVTKNFHLHRTIKEGKFNKDEVVTKKGEIKKVEIKTSSLEFGGTRYLIEIFRDLTDRMRIEAQLRQAQKMESIGTMAGGIAHDFNNILFRMYGYLEMALEEVAEGSAVHDYITEVYGEAMRARDLVKQILSFCRQSEHEFKPIEIQLIAKEAVKLLKSSIPSTIEVTHYIKNDCGQVLADSSQIHQVIMNLATNAFQAMEETGGKLSLGLKEIELTDKVENGPTMIPGKYACLTVIDTGIGMAPHIMDRIFDPYFTTKEKEKGTGLGLSIIQGIVKNHAGHITVDSTPGQGSVFNIYFPVISHTPEVEEATETESRPQKGNERILLVDDEEPIIQMERRMLERLGYQITAFSNSEMALEGFRAEPHSFDLIITDLTMPNLTGEKLAEKLLEIRPDIPIIMCTGFAEKISWDIAMSIGIKALLIKPVKLREMSNEIRAVLDAR